MERLWENTTEESNLRSFVVDMWLGLCALDEILLPTDSEQPPTGFLIRLVRRLAHAGQFPGGRRDYLRNWEMKSLDQYYVNEGTDGGDKQNEDTYLNDC